MKMAIYTAKAQLDFRIRTMVLYALAAIALGAATYKICIGAGWSRSLQTRLKGAFSLLLLTPLPSDVKSKKPFFHFVCCLFFVVSLIFSQKALLTGDSSLIHMIIEQQVLKKTGPMAEIALCLFCLTV